MRLERPSARSRATGSLQSATTARACCHRSTSAWAPRGSAGGQRCRAARGLQASWRSTSWASRQVARALWRLAKQGGERQASVGLALSRHVCL